MASPTVEAFLRIALRQQGDPYVFGAEGPGQFDCSGFVWFALARAGVNIPRTTAQGFYSQTPSIGRGALKPGDLIFYNYGRLGSGQADHIAIYLGNGKQIDASSSEDRILIRGVDWGNAIGYGRTDQLAGKGRQASWVGGAGVGGTGGASRKASAAFFSDPPSRQELRGILRGYGLNPDAFGKLIENAIQQQWGDEELLAALYDSDEFTEMFPGIFNKDGSLKMSPSEWNQLAFGPGGYQDIAREFGIKLGRAGIGTLIGGNVSPDEWTFKASVLKRARSSEVYRQELNKLVPGQKLGKKEWFDYIAGKPNARIENLFEAAELRLAEPLDLSRREARKAARQIGEVGELVDMDALLAQVKEVHAFIAPELDAAGITDADLAVLQSGADPKNLQTQLQQILASRTALVGKRLASANIDAEGGLFPALRSGL